MLAAERRNAHERTGTALLIICIQADRNVCPHPHVKPPRVSVGQAFLPAKETVQQD